MTSIDVAVVVCTYQMPGHLARVLASLAQQTIAARMEVVVSDDGSTDGTQSLVARFARRARFPVRFVTHPRDGFQLARCRNDGFRASTAQHVLFLDGDCLVPPDHIEQHLAVLRPGIATNSYCVRLDQPTSERITVETVERSEFTKLRPAGELRKLKVMHLKASLYNLLRHPKKPNLRGGNVGICRADFLRVNGLDENFRAWGGEDDDLGWRLRTAGLRIESVLHRTRTYHLWHPPSPTKVDKHHEQHHFSYLYRPFRLTRCLDGVVKRRPEDLVVRLAGEPPVRALAERVLRGLNLVCSLNRDQEVDLECVVTPGSGRFSALADVKILVALEESFAAQRLLGQAHIVLSPSGSLGSTRQTRLKLDDAGGLWAALGGRPLTPAGKRRAA
jgi:glycosyltransferase involved in cell wall biosynthesis